MLSLSPSPFLFHSQSLPVTTLTLESVTSYWNLLHVLTYCLVYQSVSGAEKINMKVGVRDPSCALIAMVPMPHRLEIALFGRKQKKLSASAFWAAVFLAVALDDLEWSFISVVSGSSRPDVSCQPHRIGWSFGDKLIHSWKLENRIAEYTECNKMCFALIQLLWLTGRKKLQQNTRKFLTSQPKYQTVS